MGSFAAEGLRCYDLLTVLTPDSSPPLAFIHGRLFGVASGADSLLVNGGVIEFIADASEVLSRCTPRTQVYDLAGRRLLPGFQDGHAHFLQLGMRAARPDLCETRSLAESLDVVRAALETAPRHVLLVAEGWDESKWQKPMLPTREDLDRLAPGRAIVLRRVCGHSAVASSGAIAWLATRWGSHGIDPRTGVLLEGPILALDQLVGDSDEETSAAFERAGAECLSRGITTSCDFLRGNMREQYARQLQTRGLPLRVVAYQVEGAGQVADELRVESTPFFVLAGRKVFADGSIGSRTAALSTPYADRNSRGELLLDLGALVTSIRSAHDHGESIAVHAIGDRAIEEVIEAFSRFDPLINRARLDRIEHFEMPDAEDADMLAKIGVRPCMQPNFVGEWGHAGGLYEQALGKGRVQTMNPLRSVLKAECGLFFGSDGMPTSPLYGIRSAMKHPEESERLSFEEGVRLYTRAVAEALGPAPRTGRIAPGWVADLTVLPIDLIPEESTAKTRVDLTILDGRVVFDAGHLLPLARMIVG